MQAQLARVGVTIFALLFAIAIATERQAAGSALIATAETAEGPAPVAAVFVVDGPAAVSAFQPLPGPAAEVAAFQPLPAPAAEAAAPAVAVVPVAQLTAPAADGGIVLASWYGPGFYGNRTACGQVYTPELLGVAHKTLPCGTLLTLTYGSHVLTVPVIDRGPYVAGRTLDLSNATKLAIGCTDLCTLRMQILR